VDEFASEGEKMPSLTDNQKQMLIHALPMGHIYLMNAAEIGDFVRSGNFDYFDEADPALQATGVDTLHQLQGVGHVRFEQGQLYNLTGSGFEQARKSQAELQPA
jgi:hypothetical protein